jgi:Fur family ferric uptake transcriptional regulator
MKEEWVKHFNRYLAERSLRHSERREQVVRVFFASAGHVGIEELFRRVQRINPKIGIATVYRTLNLLVDSGLAYRRNFDTGAVTYERPSEHHHDHLICSQCHQVVEFHNEKVEGLQDEIAQKHGFLLHSHKMELYGTCGNCRQKSQIKTLRSVKESKK